MIKTMADKEKYETEADVTIRWYDQDGCHGVVKSKYIPVSQARALIAGDAVIVSKADLENVLLGMEIGSDNADKWDSYYNLKDTIRRESEEQK